MVLNLFRPPGDGEKLMDCKLGDICDAVSLEYEEFFCCAGTFTLELPTTSVFLDKIQPNVLIYSREDDMCWIIKNIKDDMNTVTVTGYDLNGLLLDRLTMAAENPEAGTEGKDAISGSTESCVKHYVEYNLISSVVTERNIPRLACAEDSGRGITADSYLASYASVDDVVRTMCEGAKLGYRIRLNITDSATEPLFIFDVIEQTDRTADQNERNRVVFSVGRQNINGMEREVGITAERNAIWCVTGGIDGFVYDGDAPASWDRREEYVSLSVTDPYNEDYINAAVKKERADKFAETDSLTADAGDPLEYRVRYDLGDIVTVYDRDKKLQLNTPISAVKVERSATEYTVKLTFGESKPKLLDSYAKRNQLVSRSQRDFPAVNIEHTAALTTYSQPTDDTAICNGITYTVEKDSATGLITRITDDLGGELAPELSATLTDVTSANTLLWAVAMARGLRSQAAELPIFNYGDVSGFNTAYSDYYYKTVDGALHNSMGDGSPDESTLTQDAITLKYLFYNNLYYHKWFVLATPIRNNYRKLRVTAQVDGKVASWNVAHFYVGRSFDPTNMTGHFGGVDDVQADYYFTNYGDASKPQSVAKTTVELDISGCIGDDIYIGFHHCCNDFILYSIALIK